ncbi:bacterial regulatory helix-turn-helix, lysR family protein, partial [Vibrio parahaemolyticus V-223/04]
TAFFSLSLL